MTKKIIILDFATAEIIVTEFPDKFSKDDIQDFFDYFNEKEGYELREKNCEYMITESDLEIRFV